MRYEVLRYVAESDAEAACYVLSAADLRHPESGAHLHPVAFAVDSSGMHSRNGFVTYVAVTRTMPTGEDVFEAVILTQHRTETEVGYMVTHEVEEPPKMRCPRELLGMLSPTMSLGAMSFRTVSFAADAELAVHRCCPRRDQV
jgi:hypothetical protein